MRNFEVEYTINLGNLYSTCLNSLYVRKDEIYDNRIISSKDEFCGYFDYKLFNKEDEIKVKAEARRLLIDFIDFIINENELQNKINESSNSISSLYISKIEFHPIKYKYTDDVEFTLYTKIHFK